MQVEPVSLHGKNDPKGSESESLEESDGIQVEQAQQPQDELAVGEGMNIEGDDHEVQTELGDAEVSIQSDLPIIEEPSTQFSDQLNPIEPEVENEPALQAYQEDSVSTPEMVYQNVSDDSPGNEGFEIDRVAEYESELRTLEEVEEQEVPKSGEQIIDTEISTKVYNPEQGDPEQGGTKEAIDYKKDNSQIGQSNEYDPELVVEVRESQTDGYDPDQEEISSNEEEEDYDPESVYKVDDELKLSNVKPLDVENQSDDEDDYDPESALISKVSTPTSSTVSSAITKGPAGLPPKPPVNANVAPTPIIQSTEAQLLDAYNQIMQSDIVRDPKFVTLSQADQMKLIMEQLNKKNVQLQAANSANYNQVYSFNKPSRDLKAPIPLVPVNEFCRRPNITAPMTPGEIQAYDEFIKIEAYYNDLENWDEFPDNSRLFVGNLPANTVSKQDLFRIFSQYGEVIQIAIKAGYGFVQFRDLQSCMDCIKGETNVPLHNKLLRLDPSRPQKSKRPGRTEDVLSSRGRERSVDDSTKRRKVAPDCQVYITGQSTVFFIRKVKKAFASSQITIDTEDVTHRDMSEVISEAAYSGVLGACIIKELKVDIQTFESTPDGGVKFDEYAEIEPEVGAEILLKAKQKKYGNDIPVYYAQDTSHSENPSEGRFANHGNQENNGNLGNHENHGSLGNQENHGNLGIQGHHGTQGNLGNYANDDSHGQRRKRGRGQINNRRNQEPSRRQEQQSYVLSYEQPFGQQGQYQQHSNGRQYGQDRGPGFQDQGRGFQDHGRGLQDQGRGFHDHGRGQYQNHRGQPPISTQTRGQGPYQNRRGQGYQDQRNQYDQPQQTYPPQTLPPQTYSPQTLPPQTYPPQGASNQFNGPPNSQTQLLQSLQNLDPSSMQNVVSILQQNQQGHPGQRGNYSPPNQQVYGQYSQPQGEYSNNSFPPNSYSQINNNPTNQGNPNPMLTQVQQPNRPNQQQNQPGNTQSLMETLARLSRK